MELAAILRAAPMDEMYEATTTQRYNKLYANMNSINGKN